MNSSSVEKEMYRKLYRIETCKNAARSQAQDSIVKVSPQNLYSRELVYILPLDCRKITVPGTERDSRK